MLIIPLRESRTSRRRKIRPAPAPAAGLVVTGIAAVYYDAGANKLYVGPQLDVTAENPLVDVAAASGAKWWARYDGMLFAGVSVTQTDVNQIEIVFDYQDNTAEPNRLAYTNDPSDIADASGRTLAAFDMAI